MPARRDWARIGFPAMPATGTGAVMDAIAPLFRRIPGALALVLGIVAGGGAGPAGAQTPAAPAESTSVETVVEAEVAVRGIVTAIDAAQRLVTLDTGTGSRVLPVDPRVADLDRLAVGDVIDMRYHRSVLFDIKPAGSAEPGAYIAESGRRADRDQGIPDRIGEQEVTLQGTVGKLT